MVHGQCGMRQWWDEVQLLIISWKIVKQIFNRCRKRTLKIVAEPREYTNCSLHHTSFAVDIYVSLFNACIIGPRKT